MKKIKNKFIIGVFAILTAIIAYIFFSYSPEKHSFVTLVDGVGKINTQELQLQQKTQLEGGDEVQLFGTSSLAIVEWGDGSITRLGGDTKILIQKHHISSDEKHIQISFRLLEGKTWSNVVSFFGEESYFIQSFRDHEAAVRGTVFSVDFDKEYVYVTKHGVTLRGENKKPVHIGAYKPFSLQTFSFIDLTEFIKNIKDNAWEALNKKLDIEYLQQIKAQLERDIEEIAGALEKIDAKDLSEKQKQALYDKALSYYQQLHTISPDDSELFVYKQKFRNILIQTATPENRKQLLQLTLYDFKGAMKNKSKAAVSSVLEVISGYNEVVKQLPNLQDYISLDMIPVGLREQFKQDFQSLFNILQQNNMIDNMQEIGEKTLDTVTNDLLPSYK